MGTVPPGLDVQDLGMPGRLMFFDVRRNVIVVNEGAMLNGKPAFDLADPVGRARLVNLMLHESRHAEQYYHAVRFIVQATGGMAVPQGGEIHFEIVQAALEHPIEPGTPEYEIGQKAWDEFFGPEKSRSQYGQNMERRTELNNQVEQLTEARDTAEAELEKTSFFAIGKKLRLESELAELQTDLIQAKSELDNRRDVYRNLFHEQDASATAMTLTKEMPKAELRRAADRLDRADELLRMVRRLSKEAESETQALEGLNAAMRAYYEALRVVGEGLRAEGSQGGTPAPAGAGAKKP